MLSAHLDVEGLRRALRDIGLEYERDASTAAMRIDALIESLRVQLREAAAHAGRRASPDPAVPGAGSGTPETLM